MKKSTVNYQRIAESIADVINHELGNIDDRRESWEVAIELLTKHGLIDEYRRETRKRIISKLVFFD